MSLWIDGFAVFDTETSGVNVQRDRIVTATVASLPPNQPPDIQTWLADPGIPIPAGASDVHGIVSEYAREHGRPAAEVVEEVAEALATVWARGYPVCAYNAVFDLTLLNHELMRHHQRKLTIDGPVVDPLIIDKQVEKYRPGSRKLADVCRRYRIKIENAHDATEDALATGRVMWRIAHYYRQIAAMTPDQLHISCHHWYTAQQRSFARYLRTEVAGKVRREAEELDYQGALEEAEQKHAEAADIIARAAEISDTAGQWPIRYSPADEETPEVMAK